MKFRVALAQTTPKTNDKKSNLEKMKENIFSAAKQGAKLVVFPELALSGYECGNKFYDIAESIPGPSVNQVCQ